MGKTSIIVPARGCRFLYNTVEDIFEKASGDIEVIVMSDGENPDPPLENHKNLRVISTPEVFGMRRNVNFASQLATGKYLMKCDDHCMFAEGFDEILKKDCEPNWLCVPSRYYLNGESWKPLRRYGTVDYMFLTYPFQESGVGFNNPKWLGPHGRSGGRRYLENKRKHIKIDDILVFQGSCWFMHKELFDYIDGLDDVNCFLQGEAQELSFKVWLSGGRVVRNKKTWYAHLHKGRMHKRPYKVPAELKNKTKRYLADYWMNNRWPKQTRKVSWLINKFWPLDGWPESWESL